MCHCKRHIKLSVILCTFFTIGIGSLKGDPTIQTRTDITVKLIDLIPLISNDSETFGIKGTVESGGHATVTLTEPESSTLIYEVKLTSSSTDNYSGTPTGESLFNSAFCTFWSYFGGTCTNSSDYQSHYQDVVGPVLDAKHCWGDPDFANCYENALLEDHTISLVAKLETNSATVTRVNLPGLGEINPDLLFNHYTKLRIQGSNYQFDPLSLGQTLGYDGSASITFFNSTSDFYNAGLLIAAPYDNLSNPNDPTDQSYWTSYSDFESTFKIHFDNTQNVTYMAYGRGTSSSARTVSDLTTALGSPSGLTAIAEEQGSFEITYTNPDNTTLTKTFDIFRVTCNSSIVYEATAEGPFAMAHEMDNRFKPNADMAARKLYNRYQTWGQTGDFVICAHRGIWDKVGSHYPVDYSGEAANTFTTYEQAISGDLAGYIDLVEMDTRRTSDGVFVCNHDQTIQRTSNFADDAECISIENMNKRSKAWKDLEGGNWAFSGNQISDLTWDQLKDLHLRDYLGCKVKVNGSYVYPLQLSDALTWMRSKNGNGLPTNIDFKDGLKYLDELFGIVLETGMEGQVNFMFYVNDFTMEHYRKEYGRDFMRQLSCIPNLYIPKDSYKDPFTGETSDFGVEGMLQRFEEYMKYSVLDNYTFTGVILNMNNGDEEALVELANKPFYDKVVNGYIDQTGIRIKPKWTFSHYLEPFMTSLVDRNKISIPRHCNSSQHLNSEVCVDLFWRADYDWMLNNGVNGLYSDGVESLVEYLIAKGKISRQ